MNALGIWSALLLGSALFVCNTTRSATGGERRRADLGIDGIRSRVLAAQDRLRSLRVIFRARAHGRTSGQELRETIAAKGRARFLRVRRFVDGRWTVALDDYDSFYDGSRFDVFYPVQRCFETTERFAIAPYTEKTRGHGFWDALGWWPPDDDSAPPTIGERTYFIRHILADPKCQVSRDQQVVDGKWCHVVEVPCAHRLWIDASAGIVLRRECFVGTTPELLSRCELKDYRKVTDGVVLPFLLTRVIPTAKIHGVFTVDEYQANQVRDETFQFIPPAGTLVSNRDTDTAYQVPGGFECFDKIVERAAMIANESRAKAQPRGWCSIDELVVFLGTSVFVVSVIAVARLAVRMRRRMAIHVSIKDRRGNVTD